MCKLQLGCFDNTHTRPWLINLIFLHMSFGAVCGVCLVAILLVVSTCQ